MTRRRLMFAASCFSRSSPSAPGAATFTGTQAPAAAATVAKTAPPEYGPANGTLVIVGGGSTDGTTIMEKFVQRRRGWRARGRFALKKISVRSLSFTRS
jgi:hypothetical protein